MYRILLLLVVTLISTGISAQKYIHGKPIEDKSFLKDRTKAIGVVDGDIYSMNVEKSTYPKGVMTLSKIDKNFKLIFKKELDIKVPIHSNVNVHIFEKKIFLFFTDINLAKIDYKYQIFDLEGNAISNGLIGSLSTQGIAFNSEYNKFTVSPNGEHVAIVVGTRRNKSDVMTLNVMKLHLKDKITDHIIETTINYSGFVSSILDEVKLDDDGNIIGIISKIETAGSGLYDFDLFVLNNNSELINKQEISAKGYYFREFSIDINKNNEVKLWGNYYSKKNKQYYLGGFFIADYDMLDYDFTNVNFKPLSGSILDIYGKPDRKGEYSNFYGKFKVKNFDNNDGSGFLIAERSISFFGYELLIIPYNKQNVFSSYTFIPKSQNYKSGNYFSMSYFAFTDNNELNVFFNASSDIVESTNAYKNDVMSSATKKNSKSFHVKVTLDSERKISVFEENAATKRSINTYRSFSIDGIHIMTMIANNKIIYGGFE
jgi:hypothetical protein